ncbi:hypothetical protein T190_01680 [Sinorhizobium meliloti CCBAU 01290]|nr:hypothetical protein T190_01680 [Sinorhizobium meliloti CCBAU 01290]
MKNANWPTEAGAMKTVWSETTSMAFTELTRVTTTLVDTDS